jgi:HK97 gp10 family phage protein
MTPAQAAAKLSPARLALTMTEAMHKAVLIAEAGSKKRTPVKRGTLRRSETSRVEGAGMKVRGIVGTNIIYGPFVHNGTRRMRARPFFEWGLADSQARIVKVFQDAGQDFLAGVK